MKSILQILSFTALLSLTCGYAVAQSAGAPTQCIADFGKAADDAEKIYLDGIAKKTINPSDSAATAYKKNAEELNKKFKDALSSKKLTPADCSAFLKTANEHKAAVAKLNTAK